MEKLYIEAIRINAGKSPHLQQKNKALSIRVFLLYIFGISRCKDRRRLCQPVAEVQKKLISSDILFAASILKVRCPSPLSASLHPLQEVERESSKRFFDDVCTCSGPSHGG